jgi:hypothetical protein
MTHKNKTVRQKYASEHYIKNKALYKSRAILRRRKRALYLRKLKVDKGCKICGEKHPACLDFHHISEKEFNICSASHNMIPFHVILKEIEKCEVLCSNCHRKIHWKDNE